ncbi:hypothetical protein LOTGIDRAFT_238160 [Lottia gigantea]|uniref:Rho-GAP domain-containing protein n=1 Tax=Lottia gigantea TaxID=225164 RepID=V4B278_LOTGI|nr:hypothetical protein LOTGIDRAFT_238160 [Lottia gigantea]ESP01771.1 hypothetical protein LOTGIDRAFT_238160 [Lottia gigantea]
MRKSISSGSIASKGGSSYLNQRGIYQRRFGISPQPTVEDMKNKSTLKHQDSNSKLTMVAAFDDLCRDSRVLKESCEYEFKIFVKNQEDCRRKWSAAEQKVEVLQEKVGHLTSENGRLQTILKHSKSQIDYEKQKRKEVEIERDFLKRQVNNIQEMLNPNSGNSIRLNDHDREKLAFISINHPTFSHQQKKMETIYDDASVSDLDDISYDFSYDHDKSRRLSEKRPVPSAPPMDQEHIPHKRQRHASAANNSIITTTTIAINEHGTPEYAETNIQVPKLNKSFSESALNTHVAHVKHDRDIDSDPESEDSFWGASDRNRNRNNRCTPDSTPMRKSNSASNGLNRLHIFITENKPFKHKSCACCGIKMKGKFMKCKNCKSSCHIGCKDKLPLPCFPCTVTPGKKMEGVISDFTSVEPPMLPPLIVHCINEIESRGLNEKGIYRVPGSSSEVRQLKEKFLKEKGIPTLSNIRDIHVLCGCIKDFLRGLKEPLVTYALWHDFVAAAEKSESYAREDALYECIDRLPQPNRDTMAFIMIHLLRVSEASACQMPASNLARVFGPTIVGYSSPDLNMNDMMETHKINLVMENLLRISHDYWQKYMDVENSYIYPTEKTPGSMTPGQGAYVSRLGPILTPGSYEEYQRNTVLSQTQNTPRPLMPPLRMPPLRSSLRKSQTRAPLAASEISYL